MTRTDEGPGQVTFEPWDDAGLDGRPVAVDGDYSRTAWLPVLGATTWLVWGALATRLDRADSVSCRLEELAPPWVGSGAVVAWCLDRLEGYGLAAGCGGTWAIRRACPPLCDRQLARAPSTVRAVHSVTF